MTKPVGIQLSRRRGFNLQAASRAANGRPARKVSRGTKFGNPFCLPSDDCAFASIVLDNGIAIIREHEWTVDQLVSLHRDWVTGKIVIDPVNGEDLTHRFYFKTHLQPPDPAALRDALCGYNLACWCPLDAPCHRNILLELANG